MTYVVAVPLLLLIAGGAALFTAVMWRPPTFARRGRRRDTPQPERQASRSDDDNALDTPADASLWSGAAAVLSADPAPAYTEPALVSTRARLPLTQAALAPVEPPLRPEPADDRARRMVGYASWDGHDGAHARAVHDQAEKITLECDRLGVGLLQLVREREPQRGRALERPGLGYALESISAGEAAGLMVADLSRLTHSAAELGRVLQWFVDADARLVAVSQGLDTHEESGQLAVRALIDVSRWEHERLAQRTRNGMRAARRKGPPGVADHPQLKERIEQMRAAGMTLEAIAGQLNREGTPTVRGGAKWRPSSVQVAAGYRRPPAGRTNNPHRNGASSRPSNGSP